MPHQTEWACYRAVFDAMSPIHIGWHALGIIRRTRYYIPARNVWGALVAGLAPVLYGGEQVPEMYAECEKRLRDELRFTYLFPSAPPGSEPLLPDYHPNDGLRLGGKPAEDFERRFVSSQTSTALNPESFTAEEGALHESEYISPAGRRGGTGAGEKLSFIGHFLLKAGFQPDLLKEGLASMRLGSDRNYGWGWLKLREWATSDGNLFGICTISSDLIITNRRAGAIPAHVDARPDAGDGIESAIEGDIELLRGREWCAERGSGRKFSEAIPAWAPGSRFPEGTKFTIQATGLWTLATQAS